MKCGRRFGWMIVAFIWAMVGSAFAQNVLSPTAIFLGTGPKERIGYSVNTAGDVNGDGYDDFLIGGFHSGWGGSYSAGRAYLMLGRVQADWGTNFSLNNADGIFGGSDRDYAGWAVTGGGDIDGDGYDDFIIGAASRSGSGQSGRAYLIFGRQAADWGRNFYLANSADVTLIGERDGDYAGHGVSILGDLNKDGFDDFLISAMGNNGGTGKIYFFFGKGRTGWNKSMDLQLSCNASFVGDASGISAGYCISGLGDVNGDGVPDFIIGTHGGNKAFLVFGRISANWGKLFNLNNADVIFSGENSNDGAGHCVAGAGDANGDGLSDILISAPSYNNSTGKAYVIFGKTGTWLKYVSLADTAYVKASFIGEAAGDLVGLQKSICGGGDYNGDGLDDLLFGARGNDQASNDAGKFYLVYGKNIGWQRNVSLASSDAYFKKSEADTSHLGLAVNFAGDVNGDGADDIVVSAPIYSGGTYNPTSYDFRIGKVNLFCGKKSYYAVSGVTTYISNAYRIENVRMNLTGDGASTMNTNSQGQYSFQKSMGSSFIITPSKPADENVGAKTISSYDAALTAQHSVGLIVLNSAQQTCADADKSGTITTLDAAWICRYSVGLPKTSPSRAGEWIFNPGNRVYSIVQQDYATENFEGYILGDVDLNWMPPLSLGKGNASTGRITNMDIPLLRTKVFRVDGRVTVPFSVEEADGMISLDVVFSYDPTIFQLVNVIKTPLIQDFTLMYNEVRTGTVKVGVFGTQALQQTGEVIELIFESAGNEDIHSELVVERFEINGGRNVETSIPLTITEVPTLPEDFRLHQNFPNPFNPETVVRYDLPKAMRVELAVINLLGVRVKTLVDGVQAAGFHHVVWDGTDDARRNVESGIYFCRAFVGDRTFHKKMIKMQ
ncbi:MAG: cohesin domain-containing protein [bacterium]